MSIAHRVHFKSAFVVSLLAAGPSACSGEACDDAGASVDTAPTETVGGSGEGRESTDPSGATNPVGDDDDAPDPTGGNDATGGDPTDPTNGDDFGDSGGSPGTKGSGGSGEQRPYGACPSGSDAQCLWFEECADEIATCTERCDEDQDCSAAPSGTSFPRCEFTDDSTYRCVLYCGDGSQCPEGMSCREEPFVVPPICTWL